jgi:hypothetical protein
VKETKVVVKTQPVLDKKERDESKGEAEAVVKERKAS